MIRRFNLSDLFQILKIEHKSFPKSPYDWETFVSLFSKYPDTFLVFTNKHKKGEEEIWGYIIYSPDGHIISIAVHPKYRRKGVGTKLINQALSSPHLKKVWAEVRQSNTIAHAFYLKLGFEIIGILPNYYGDEDAILVELKPNLKK